MKKSINKKGEGEIKHLAIAVIIIAIFMVGIIAYGVDINKNYNMGFDDSEFHNTFNRVSALSGNLSLPMQENFENKAGTVSGQAETSEILLQSGTKSVNLILNIPGLLSDMLINGYRLISRGVGIPPMLISGISAIIGIIIAVSLWATVFKREP